MRILFVENHAVFAQTVIREFLPRHQVILVSSLAEARSQLASAHFDVILVDYDLDDGKGVEIVEETRARELPIRVIAVSSRAAGNEALLQAGADAVCSKLDFANIESILGVRTR